MELRWITDGHAEPLTVRELPAALSEREGFAWLCLEHDDGDAMATLSKVFAVREADIEECHVRTPVPKVRSNDDHVFAAINGLVRGDDGRLHFQPIKTFFSGNRLATVLGPTNEAVSPEAGGRELGDVLSRLDASEFRPTSAVELSYEIREGILRSHDELIRALAIEITEVERRTLSCDPARSERLIEELFRVRHDLQVIRTNAAQNHDLYVRVAELGVAQGADEQRLIAVRQGFEHVRNSADLEREYLQELLDLFETRVATELNRFVRQLTAWGAIGIAATLIAGIYGMNFAHMPELDWKFGYPMALGLMVLVGVLLAAFFRRHGWF